MNKKIDVGTRLRTVLLFVALINQILVSIGWNELPVGEGEIKVATQNLYVAGSTVFTIVTALISWWKDNPISRKARAKKAKEENRL